MSGDADPRPKGAFGKLNDKAHSLSTATAKVYEDVGERMSDAAKATLKGVREAPQATSTFIKDKATTSKPFLSNLMDFIEKTAAPVLFKGGALFGAAIVLIVAVTQWLLLMEIHKAAKVGQSRVKECGGHAYLEGETPGYELYTKMVQRDYKARFGRMLQWSNYTFMLMTVVLIVYILVIGRKTVRYFKNPPEKGGSKPYGFLCIVWILLALYAFKNVLSLGGGGIFKTVAMVPQATSEERNLSEKQATTDLTADLPGTYPIMVAVYVGLLMLLGKDAFFNDNVPRAFWWTWGVVLAVAAFVVLYGKYKIVPLLREISKYQTLTEAVDTALKGLNQEAVKESLYPHMVSLASRDITLDEGGPDLPTTKDCEDAIKAGRGVPYVIHMDGNEFSGELETDAGAVGKLRLAMANLRNYHDEIVPHVGKALTYFNVVAALAIFTPIAVALI